MVSTTAEGVPCLCSRCRRDAALNEVEDLRRRLEAAGVTYQRELRELHLQLRELQARLDTMRIEVKSKIVG